jgi:nitrate reductase (NAD(P)H)
MMMHGLLLIDMFMMLHNFSKEHSGGVHSIILASGDDASEHFLVIHSNIVKSILRKYHIGILQTSNTKKK